MQVDSTEHGDDAEGSPRKKQKTKKIVRSMTREELEVRAVGFCLPAAVNKHHGPCTDVPKGVPEEGSGVHIPRASSHEAQKHPLLFLSVRSSVPALPHSGRYCGCR